MDRWTREGLLSANNGLRNQVEDLVDAYSRRQDRLSETYQQLEAMRVRATSPDCSVEVTVDAGGVLADMRLTDSALRNSPDALARTIVDAVQEAARQARDRQNELAAPLIEEFDAMGDLTDIVPEAPGLGDIRAHFRGDQRPSE